MPQFTVMRITNIASVAYLEAANEEQAKEMAESLSTDSFTIASEEFYDTILAE